MAWPFLVIFLVQNKRWCPAFILTLGILFGVRNAAAQPFTLQGPGVVGEDVELSWDRGRLQQAEDLNGPWSDAADAFSPQLVSTIGHRKFYLAVY